MLLSRDWSARLGKYFATDWSHMLVPKKGKNNYQRIEQEIFMKHTMIELEATNELAMFTNSILENYFLDSFFGGISPETSPFADINTQSELLHCTLTDELKDESTSATQTNLGVDISKTYIIESNLDVGPANSNVHISDNTNIQDLLFEDSKSQEGARVGYILRDRVERITIMPCRLEFECTNNTVEYETLLQGLRKALDLKVKHIKVFGDSEVIVHQVNNAIHCNLGHLKGYQHEVWKLKALSDSFEIVAIPRNYNTYAYLLANVVMQGHSEVITFDSGVRLG